MKKKTKKDKKQHLPQLKVRHCMFGFALKPRCGAYNIRFDLQETPELKLLIADGTIPPYCFQFINESVVIVDQCLVCHLKKGYTIEEYERKNEAAGITRSNYKEVFARADWDHAAKKIKRERQELIKEGFPLDVEDRKLRDA